ncbi:MAG: hypothetical protein ABIQ73_03790 [Acidimicrobiales bacterium]
MASASCGRGHDTPGSEPDDAAVGCISRERGALSGPTVVVVHQMIRSTIGRTTSTMCSRDRDEVLDMAALSNLLHATSCSVRMTHSLWDPLIPLLGSQLRSGQLDAKVLDDRPIGPQGP